MAVIYSRGQWGKGRERRPETTYGNVRSTRNRLGSSRTARCDSSVEIWEARRAYREDGSRGRVRDQYRDDSQQDDAGSGSASFRILLAKYLRCELSREGTDHDGGPV